MRGSPNVTPDVLGNPGTSETVSYGSDTSTIESAARVPGQSARADVGLDLTRARDEGLHPRIGEL